MAKDSLRYSRITDVLQILYMMMAEPSGITLENICDEFNVSRRTAERMRDSIINIFPQVSVLNEDEKVKRWGFTNFSMKEIVTFTDKEIATIEVLQQHFKAKTLMSELTSILDKMRILREKDKHSKHV